MRGPARWCVAVAAIIGCGVTALAIAPPAPPMPALVAQAVLAQLGLTEASARTFLFEEMKSQTGGHRRGAVQVAGHRAFYKLPPAARGPAATALFAWARTYVDSPAFKTAYAQHRKEANPVDERAAPSVESQLDKELKAGQEMARQIAEKLPPAERDKMLAMIEEQEKQMAETRARVQKAMEAEQAERQARSQASGAEFNARFPADPNQLVARRLRAFLDETADADFAAPIIRLTDGPDGMEFISPAHRAKSVTWQLAVLAGPDATKAARAAAAAWLKDVAP